MRQLRILLVMHMPWDRNLGGPRVQIELADEFLARGHSVEKFDFFDAFPEGRGKLASTLAPRAFCARARDYIRSNSARFDVVDAHHGNLPFGKQELGFDGLLVARSGGLHFFYRDFEQFAREKWPARSRGRVIGRLLRRWQAFREGSTYLKSLEHADLVVVQNADERVYVTEVLGLGHKTILAPCGLSDDQAALLAANADRPSRLGEKEIAFIGQWGLRKGRADWGRIVRRIREVVPDARFIFLGTGCEAERVIDDLDLGTGDGVRVVPRYDSDELPGCLAGATLGAFPSYIEGFGIGVLEMLASGLPTVAYDVPGPRETLNRIDPSLLVPVGDAEALAERIADLLRLSSTDYAELVQRCLAVTKGLRWSDIAAETLSAYTSALGQVQSAETRQPALS
jgi:glycosyltransferase involved in cell wall biosynthesis